MVFRWIIGLILFTAVCSGLWILAVQSDLQWEAVWDYRQLFFKGWVNTLWISTVSLLLSVFIGGIVALLRRSTYKSLVVLATAYVELVRGTPLLVQILFFYYVIAHAVGIDDRYVVGIVVLSLFEGAYIAEIVRSGIDAIRTTQIDSARAIGLTSFQAYRFVIIPQAARQVLPPLTGQFASIIKDSSLLSIIGINELTYSAQQINSATYSTLEAFLPLAVAYLALTLPISLWSRWLEGRYHYEA